jgi:hypothetical protein
MRRHNGAQFQAGIPPAFFFTRLDIGSGHSVPADPAGLCFRVNLAGFVRPIRACSISKWSNNNEFG